MTGLEPARRRHQILNLARLPIPPYPRLLPDHFNTEYHFCQDDILFLLKNMGYEVIIAHPERYKFVQEDIEYAKKWVDRGCLLQANYGSIVELYGKEAKKTLKKLLKLDLISFLGTDTHKQGTIYKEIPHILKKLKKYISEEKLYELTEINPKKILENEVII